MSLTKKQKRYIQQHGQELSIQEISRQLGLAESAVVNALQEMKISVSKPAGLKSFSGQYDLLNHPYFIPGVLAAFSLLIGILCFDSKFNTTGDNIEFLDLGTSIREGRGIMGTTKYTFLFPLFLAGIQAITNNSFIAQKILVVFFYVFCAPFLFWIFRRNMHAAWAAAIVILSVTNTFIIEFGHDTMSEVPYLFFSTIAIVAFDKAIENPARKRDFVLALIAIIAVYYVRPAALALFAAAVAYFALRRQWKLAIFAGGVFFIAVLPWNIRSQLLAGGSDYSKVLFLRNPYSPELGNVTFSELLQRVWYNVNLYATQEIPYTLFPFRFRTTLVHPELFPSLYGVMLTLMALAGYIWYSFRHQDILSLYLFFYMGIILIWPEVWSSVRFIIPVIPFFIFFLVYFVYQVIEVTRRYQFATVIKAAGIIFIFVIGVLHFKDVAAWDTYMGKYPPEWANYFKAAEWVRDNTPQDAVICDRKAGLFKMVARRKCVGTPGSSFGNDPIRHLKFFYEHNVDYVIIPSIPYPDIGRCLLPAVQALFDRFALVYKLDNPGTYIVKLNRTMPLPEGK